MEALKLSKRLQKISEFIVNSEIFADIGSDHALLPIFAVNNGLCQKAIVTDINKGPLEAAQKNIVKYAIKNDCFSLRLGNGLAPLTIGEADTISICGMGGILIADILKENIEIARSAKLILEPNTNWEKLREFLYGEGFEILSEKGVAEDGHAYIIICAKYDGKKRQIEDYYLGEFYEQLDKEYLALLLKKSQNVLRHCENEFHQKIVEKLGKLV